MTEVCDTGTNNQKLQRALDDIRERDIDTASLIDQRCGDIFARLVKNNSAAGARPNSIRLIQLENTALRQAIKEVTGSDVLLESEKI